MTKIPGVGSEQIGKASASTNSNGAAKKKKPRIRHRIRNKGKSTTQTTETPNAVATIEPQSAIEVKELQETNDLDVVKTATLKQRQTTVKGEQIQKTTKTVEIALKEPIQNNIMNTKAVKNTTPVISSGSGSGSGSASGSGSGSGSSASATSLNSSSVAGNVEAAETREKIMTESAAKKLEKQAKKVKSDTQTTKDATTIDIKLETKPTVTKTAPIIQNVTAATTVGVTANKSREQIMIEREAKKLAKQAKKTKSENVVVATSTTTTIAEVVNGLPAITSATENTNNISKLNLTTSEKSREQIKAEREAKKQAKQTIKAAKSGVGDIETTAQLKNLTIDTSVTTNIVLEKPEEKLKPTLTKAERRAIQEAQRAAKAGALSKKNIPLTKTVKNATTIDSKLKQPLNNLENSNMNIKNMTVSSKVVQLVKTNECKIKLFNHLECARQDVSLFINNPQIHPSIARLGEQYAKRTVVGSNARCIAFLNALKEVIHDFETPAKKEFGRSLETFFQNCVDHLQKCRPLAVSMTNAHKHIKHVLTQLPTDKPETELKMQVYHFIDTYIENQIGKAAQAICSAVQEKISDGDVILTFGCSSLINYIFEEAQRRKVSFRVIVVDSRPFCEGQELLRRLTAKEIPCTYVLINAVSFVMSEATKVLLGAHALLANGYVMARTGTAQVAMVARAFNVPVLVCCETHKFSERYQTDAIVYNELGNPDDLVLNDKCCLSNWQNKGKLSLLNLIYDITPSELVTAVVTEVAILPCTSVPVILRIKPTEIGYYS